MMPDISSYLALAEKVFFILGAIIYLVFSFVIVKQTTTMSKYVHDIFNSVLITFSYLHLAFSFLLVIMTLVIL